MEAAGYLIFGIGVIALCTSYYLYRMANRPFKTHVTARELDSLWVQLGRMIIEVSENNTEPRFLRDLDSLVEKCYKYLALQSKNQYAEKNKKEVQARLKELDIELSKAKAPYRVEIRKYKLYELAKLVGVKMPKRRI